MPLKIRWPRTSSHSSKWRNYSRGSAVCWGCQNGKISNGDTWRPISPGAQERWEAQAMKPLVKVSLPYAIVLYAMLINSAYANDLPFVPFPKNVNVVVVGEDIKVNGLPIMAYEFMSNDSVDEVAKFYRD